MTGFLLDTHIWVWAQRKLVDEMTQEAFDLIETWQRSGSAYISPFSAWELSMLSGYKQIDLGGSVDAFLQVATEKNGFLLAPLTPQILIESTRLPGDLHRDPADRILAATARELGLTLVTRDKALLAYARQGHLNARKP